MQVNVSPIAENLMKNMSEKDKSKIGLFIKRLKSANNLSIRTFKIIDSENKLYLSNLDETTKLTLKVFDDKVEILDIFNVSLSRSIVLKGIDRRKRRTIKNLESEQLAKKHMKVLRRGLD